MAERGTRVERSVLNLLLEGGVTFGSVFANGLITGRGGILGVAAAASFRTGRVALFAFALGDFFRVVFFLVAIRVPYLDPFNFFMTGNTLRLLSHLIQNGLVESLAHAFERYTLHDRVKEPFHH